MMTLPLQAREVGQRHHYSEYPSHSRPRVWGFLPELRCVQLTFMLNSRKLWTVEHLCCGRSAKLAANV